MVWYMVLFISGFSTVMPVPYESLAACQSAVIDGTNIYGLPRVFRFCVESPRLRDV